MGLKLGLRLRSGGLLVLKYCPVSLLLADDVLRTTSDPHAPDSLAQLFCGIGPSTE